MIIKTDKGTYISDTDGMLLSDGMSFGIEYDLGDGRSASELSEVTREEYASSVSGSDTFSDSRAALDGEGLAEVM